MRNSTICLLILLFSFRLAAQIVNSGDTLYGHEWINFDQSYYKLQLSEDAFYRVSIGELPEFPVGQVSGSQLQLWHLGKQVPIRVSNSSSLSQSDFLEFFGQKNTSELDRYLYDNPNAEMLNPAYSLFNDTSAYFLSWANTGLRYEEIDNDLAGLAPPLPYVESKWQSIATDVLTWKRYDISQLNLVAYSLYDESEGFSSPYANSHTIDLALKAPYLSDPNAKVEVRLAANNNIKNINKHELEVSVGSNVYHEQQLTHFQLADIKFDLNSSDIGANKQLRIHGKAGSNDQYCYSLVQVDYRRLPTADGQESMRFSLGASPLDQYLEISDIDASTGDELLLIDLTNNTMTSVLFENGLAKMRIRASNEKSEYLLWNSSKSKPTNKISKVDFDQNILSSAATFIIVSDPRLYSDANGQNPVQDYATHRQSQIGGSHTVNVVTSQQLYDIFAYGINRHVFSVKNYANYLHKNAPQSSYILLLGHGNQYDLVREHNSPHLAQHFVPTYGLPGSDNLLVSSGSDVVPLLSVGRVSARNADEVRNYLNKLITYERNLNSNWTLESKLWRKNVLHLVGGSLSEATLISSLLRDMENEIKDSKINPIVETVKKESSDPVQLNTTERVIQAVNKGVLIKTFFGHGGVTVTDFGLDDPSLFNLGERYPLILSLGCLTGGSYDQQTSASERFVLARQQGGIGYVATSGFGYTSPLKNLGKEFYTQLGGDHYGKGVGDVLKEAVGKYSNSSSFQVRSLLQQINLQGDPALRLHLYDAPDYIPEFVSVNISPEIIDSQLDSFELAFDIVNIGRNATDTIVIRFERTASATGKSIQWKDTVVVSNTRTSFNYYLPVSGDLYSGQNTLSLAIDIDNDVNELPNPIAESNNSWTAVSGKKGLEFFVLDSRIKASQPRNFAIINTSALDIYAYSANIFNEPKGIIFQLDTSAYFDSPMLIEELVYSSGGSVNWKPNINLKDSTVYYWRVGFEKVDNPTVGRAWSSSSFIYLNNAKSPGWNQSHFFQFNDGSLNSLSLEEPSRQFTFEKQKNAILAISNVYSTQNTAVSSYYTNNIRTARTTVYWQGWTYDQLLIAVFDPVTGMYWGNPFPGKYGSVNLEQNREFPGFVFQPQVESSRHALMNFIADSIPEGHYVLVLAGYIKGRGIGSEMWADDDQTIGTTLFDVMEAEGATLIRNMQTQGDRPYAFAFRKGQGAIDEDIADSEDDLASVNFETPSILSNGRLLSPVIGPASKWQKLFWKTDNNGTDSIAFNIYRIKDGERELAYDNVKSRDFDLSSVDAVQYPYLQLEWLVADSVEFSPAQLRYWRVLYDGFGDAALSPDLAYNFVSDSLEEGQPLQLRMAIQNIGEKALDSLHVQFSMQDEQNNKQLIDEIFRPLEIGDSLIANIEFETRSKVGVNTISIHANPNPDQPESDFSNNFSARSFVVKRDNLNPLLDITFDGVHIMNGDIVSAEPVIMVELRDENTYLKLTDTSLLNITLEMPDGNTQPILFSDPALTFYPATGNNVNRAKVEWRPNFEQDGEYSLRVNGSDVSDNTAGILQYSVSFEVINTRSISNVLPYPNPFSTSCRFAYVLTGDKTPDVFKLQIMTVSGKVVREVSKAEFGPMRVGKHLSDFVWDGNDNYGQPLANGVYLYRVITRNIGEELERYDNGTDRFFKKDFGKLVIMR